MSLAEELLADLDDIGEVNGDVEDEDIVDVNEQLQMASKMDTDGSIHSLTKLNKSEVLNGIISKVEHYLEVGRSDESSHHTNPTESYWNNSTSQHNPYSSPQQQFMAAMMNGGGGIGPPVSPSYASAYSAGSYQTAGGYPTTSMYGHPLMTPVITGGAGSVSGRQMWYPDQSSTYNSHGHMYYQKSPGSRQSYSPLPNHS